MRILETENENSSFFGSFISFATNDAYFRQVGGRGFSGFRRLPKIRCAARVEENG